VVRNWMKLGWECSSLAFECQQVIALWLLKLSRGGTGALTEARSNWNASSHGRFAALIYKAIP
jgi:hypothetical protein